MHKMKWRKSSVESKSVKVTLKKVEFKGRQSQLAWYPQAD